MLALFGLGFLVCYNLTGVIMACLYEVVKQVIPDDEHKSVIVVFLTWPLVIKEIMASMNKLYDDLLAELNDIDRY